MYRTPSIVRAKFASDTKSVPTGPPVIPHTPHAPSAPGREYLHEYENVHEERNESVIVRDTVEHFSIERRGWADERRRLKECRMRSPQIPPLTTWPRQDDLEDRGGGTFGRGGPMRSVKSVATTVASCSVALMLVASAGCGSSNGDESTTGALDATASPAGAGSGSGGHAGTSGGVNAVTGGSSGADNDGSAAGASSAGSSGGTGDAAGSAGSGGSSGGAGNSSGSSGAGVGSDSGLDAAADAACSESAVRCSGRQPEACRGGTWMASRSPCSNNTPACLNGACVACTPDTARCNNQQPQTCSAIGSWQDSGNPCGPSTTCVAGSCTGVCGPSEKQCASSSQPQTCSATGTWQDAAACDASHTCVGGACVGECGPSQTQCVSISQPQTCSSAGTWQNAAACDGSHTCVGGTCGGACGPAQTQCGSSSQPQTCSSTGTWANAAACVGPTPFCVDASCSATAGRSCAEAGPGLSNCGMSSESCCTSLAVAGGTYYRTYQNDVGGAATAQADPATVSGFRLDKYEVTVGRFRRFAAAWNNGSGYNPPEGSGKHGHLNGGLGLVNSQNAAGTTYETGWSTADNAKVSPTNANLACNMGFEEAWTNAPGANENLPMNCVTWFEASAFCIWDGGFLPSEVEWQYAAAGGSQQRQYPWGNTDPSTMNRYAIYNCYFPNNSAMCLGGNIAPVGSASLGAGRWGQLDLAGNIYELTLDWNAPFAPCTDCANLSSGTYRMTRGGYWASSAHYLEPEYRTNGGAPPTARTDWLGFRCARVP